MEKIITFSKGWNLIGSHYNKAVFVEIDNNNPIMVENSLYKYDTEYIAADYIESGKGYWIKALTYGNIIERSYESYNIQSILPIFSQTLLNNLSSEQYELANYFSNYPFINTVESFLYNLNTPYTIIDLKNQDFINGTLRIRIPGIYRLTENIIFHPNADNDFFPSHEQNLMYPQKMMGPYHLGFFAAITVETDNVIIDLNKYKIEQSPEHNFQQRFYSNIVLANAPFIKDKGPANFQGALEFKAANRVMVHNGESGLSSHHGIFANTANNVILHNLSIKNYEVAGIALNGTNNGILSDIVIKNNNKDIKIRSTYSQARFIRNFINIVSTHNNDIKLNIQGIEKTFNNIQDELNTDLLKTFNAFKKGLSIPIEYFKNTNIEADCNVYGIVLNVNGPVVGPFLTKKNLEQMSNQGNTKIHLENIIIDNISSHPIETIGINNPLSEGSDNSYGKNRQTGPIGESFEIINKFINSNKTYIGTSLSNSQIIIANSSIKHKGTTSITNSGDVNTIKWVENGHNFNTLMNDAYLVGGFDSMGHTMKGNLGLFISGGENITGNNIHISKIINKGQDVGKELYDINPNYQNIQILPNIRSKLGSSAVNIKITACNDIKFTNTIANLDNPITKNPGHDCIETSIHIINDSTNININ